MSVSNLFDGYNAGYAQELYEKFARNPESVSREWREIFSQRLDELVSTGLIVPDGLQTNGTPHAPEAAEKTPNEAAVPTAGVDVGSGRQAGTDSPLLTRVSRATALIQAFRDHGHQLAQVDPLGSEPPGHPQLDPAFFGTSVEDLEEIPASLVLEGSGDESLAETLHRMRSVYCGSIAYQFEHLEDPDKVRWLWHRVESGRHSAALAGEAKVELLRRLTEVEGLENFLHRTYLGQKRFSIEGTDMLVPMLDLAVEETAKAGGTRIVLGMAHRGRLNVLVQIVGYSKTRLLREFEGTAQEETISSSEHPGTGDVKYHRGARGNYRVKSGMEIEVNLAPNPSHLEFVNPVAMGMSRALQYAGPEKSAKPDSSTVVPILIHGDAAFAAEGVVAESLNLARLRGYAVGGTVHIIANNQVGFTTDPGDGRSTRYASDVAKGYDIPIMHVNADDPEACLSAIRLAMAYRATYRDDVVIDLVGYRRYGHNEGDEPAYTQPLLYQKIEAHPTVRAQWAARLVEEGVIDESQAAALESEVIEALRSVRSEVQGQGTDNGNGSHPRMDSHDPDANEEEDAIDTAVSLERLERANHGALDVPDTFEIHPKLRRQLERRSTGFGFDAELEWAHAESLALGSILQEGVPIRITGQDSERGTFSQRHLVLHDQETGDEVTPLWDVGSARFEIYNSPLSETAVLGFEYGYSVAATNDFVLWEAQFGDFVNVAQVVIDQFIASGRSKWGQVSKLALLLPHGHEGQGPEHSSARLERFLQLCAEDNIRVAYPSTPAQYFHLLRRQALVEEAVRPLVVMTPKSLLRHPRASSRVSDLVEGRFHPVLADTNLPGDASDVERLILTSGKFYYDLTLADGREGLRGVAVGRVEELYPFPTDEIRALVSSYPNVKEVVWAQEEPLNMGALSYVGPRLRGAVPREISLRHVARPERASPAEGRNRSHKKTQGEIVEEALGRA